MSSTLLSSLLFSAGALALPTGGQVNGGQASITSSANQTTIDQTSQRAVIDWKNFNIGAGEKVQFIDPNASAVTLNRIHDSGASAIDGQLLSNGNVWLINPNGVLFGKNAQVNVGGLVATTSNIANSDFMSGNYSFTPGGNPNASVTNNGSITVAQSGLAALVAPNVVNNGVIQAKLGKVAMGAGDSYTLDLNGDGLINLQASPAINAQLAANHGTIKADGGTVTLTAAAASNVVDSLVNMDGLIEADTVGGKTGSVVIRSGGKTNFSGTINARGGANAGDGGYAEVSGDELSFTGKVNLSAPAGKAGRLLIDPLDLFVTADGSAPESGASGISATTVQNLLANEDVILSSTGTGSQAGDITVTAPISWSSSHVLDLDAYHSLIIGAPITITNLGGLILNTNDGGTGGGLSFPGGNVTFNNLLGGLIINGNPYTLVNNVQGLAEVAQNSSGHFALAKDYDASIDPAWGGPPVPEFYGTFEGLGNFISNLRVINGSGLFGYNQGTIENLGLKSISMTDGYGLDDGGLVGQNFGTLNQVYTTGTLSDYCCYVGGLVGTNAGIITSSYSSVNVTNHNPGGDGYETYSYVGGLVGWNQGRISNSYATGTVNMTTAILGGFQPIYDSAGGLAGENEGTIDHSYAMGSVTADNGSIGGLVGLNQSYGNLNYGNISASFAQGEVAINDTTLQGDLLIYRAGGLVGLNVGGTIDRSYATGEVNVSSGAYSIAPVTFLNEGSLAAGGLVGYDAGTITNSYALGSVYADSGIYLNPYGGNESQASIGALVGIEQGSVISNSGASGAVGNGYSYNYYRTGTGPNGPIFNVTKADFIITPSSPLPSPAPTVNFSQQVWGSNSGLNGGNPYLLWQYPLQIAQGGAGNQNTGGNGGNSGGQPGGSNPAIGNNTTGNQTGNGAAGNGTPSPILSASSFDQVAQTLLLQGRQEMISDFLGSTLTPHSPSDLSPGGALSGTSLIFDGTQLNGNPLHDDSQQTSEMAFGTGASANLAGNNLNEEDLKDLVKKPMDELYDAVLERIEAVSNCSECETLGKTIDYIKTLFEYVPAAYNTAKAELQNLNYKDAILFADDAAIILGKGVVESVNFYEILANSRALGGMGQYHGSNSLDATLQHLNDLQQTLEKQLRQDADGPNATPATLPPAQVPVQQPTVGTLPAT